MGDEMTARELLVKLTEIPSDQILPALGVPLDVLREDELEAAATTLIEHKIMEGIVSSEIAGPGHEYKHVIVPFGKLAATLNKHPTWNMIHLHLSPKKDEMYAYALFTKPAEPEEGEDGEAS